MSERIKVRDNLPRCRDGARLWEIQGCSLTRATKDRKEMKLNLNQQDMGRRTTWCLYRELFSADRTMEACSSICTLVH